MIIPMTEKEEKIWIKKASDILCHKENIQAIPR